ncbi:hypothetical protein ElyMa_003770900 [Elysia marginata]|uniref:Uncharacterized protein n=1 Tax=Elysia marginata TaxID=1093978 RepID=A0AAV4F965_9GAST|nr:hypothetical protein ElyMa_003770900 [Elysia marginata]
MLRNLVRLVGLKKFEQIIPRPETHLFTSFSPSEHGFDRVVDLWVRFKREPTCPLRPLPAQCTGFRPFSKCLAGLFSRRPIDSLQPGHKKTAYGRRPTLLAETPTKHSRRGGRC